VFTVNDALDVDLQDPELVSEILLVSELMVAASASSEPLSQAAIDDILRRAG
jgi:hypothetical protein